MSTVTPLTLLLSRCTTNRWWMTLRYFWWLRDGSKWGVTRSNSFGLHTICLPCLQLLFCVPDSDSMLSLPSNFTAVSPFPKGVSDTGRGGGGLAKSVVIAVMEYEEEGNISFRSLIYFSFQLKETKSSQSITILVIPLKENAAHEQCYA